MSLNEWYAYAVIGALASSMFRVVVMGNDRNQLMPDDFRFIAISIFIPGLNVLVTVVNLIFVLATLGHHGDDK